MPIRLLLIYDIYFKKKMHSDCLALKLWTYIASKYNNLPLLPLSSFTLKSCFVELICLVLKFKCQFFGTSTIFSLYIHITGSIMEPNYHQILWASRTLSIKILFCKKMVLSQVIKRMFCISKYKYLQCTLIGNSTKADWCI